MTSLTLLIAIYAFGGCGETADFFKVKKYLRHAQSMSLRLTRPDPWIAQWTRFFGERYDAMHVLTQFPLEVIDIVSEYELHLILCSQ